MRLVPLADARLLALGARGGLLGDGPSAPVVAVGVKVAVGCAAGHALCFFGAIRRAAGVFSIAGFFSTAIFALVPMVGVVVHPSVGPVVSRGTDGLRFCPAAIDAGKGLFARRCAGGSGGHCAIIPMMRCLGVGDMAASILFPVIVFIGPPIAQHAAVVGGVYSAVFKGFRALFPADAGCVVASRRYTVRIGSLIDILHRFLVIGVRSRIVFAIADRAHMPVLVGVAFPFI